MSLGQYAKTGIEKFLDLNEYIEAKEDHLSELVNIPEGTPLSNLRAELILEKDISYSQQEQAITYDISGSSATKTSHDLDPIHYIHHELNGAKLARKDPREIEEAASKEFSKTIHNALESEMTQKDAEKIIVRTEDWQRTISTKDCFNPIETAYNDIKRYLTT